ncbi:MAG: MATE family efflux transporter [Clostridia bacterium]|nr:MATE family efflux transporter [Clostridia bacterium]
MSRGPMVRKALAVAWPAMMESFFITLAGMIDTMMVAELGSYAVAATGLTAQPKFIGLTVFIGISVAVSALVARRKGEQNQDSAHEIVWTSLLMALLLCILITVIFVVFTPQMMVLAGSNADTHEAAVEYFQIIMGGLVFNVITMVINAAQRGSGNTKLSMTTNLASSIVNIIFNYLLIEGHFGFPAWGVRGAAIATVLGTVVSAVMAIFSLIRKNSYIQLSRLVRFGFRIRKTCVTAIWRLAGTTSLENIAMRVGFLATALIAARLGTDEFAAHNIGMNLLGLGFSFADGMQVAAIALAGESLGAGRKEDARAYGSICQRIGFVISLILAAALLCGSEWFFGLYFKERHIVEMGMMISRWIAVIILLQISQIIFTGCLRAAGDVRYTLICALISVAGIRTMVTILAVFVFKLGLTGVWLGVLSDQASRFILMAHRFHQGKWVDITI